RARITQQVVQNELIKGTQHQIRYRPDYRHEPDPRRERKSRHTPLRTSQGARDLLRDAINPLSDLAVPQAIGFAQPLPKLPTLKTCSSLNERLDVHTLRRSRLRQAGNGHNVSESFFLCVGTDLIDNEPKRRIGDFKFAFGKAAECSVGHHLFETDGDI